MLGREWASHRSAPGIATADEPEIMVSIYTILAFRLLENELWKWALALAIGFIAPPALNAAQGFGVVSLKRWATGRRRPAFEMAADLLGRTQAFVRYALALNIALFVLFLQPRWRGLSAAVLEVALLIQATLWINSIIDHY